MAERMGEGTPTIGRMVTMYTNAKPDGSPAVVTRVNVDGTLSLTVFLPGDITYRDGVQEYKWEEGDEDEDKVGYWAWPEKV